MKMRENPEEDLVGFLGDLVEDLARDKTQIRIARTELLKLIRSYLKRRSISLSSGDVFETWARILNHSLFYKDYLVKYIPAVDCVSLQWVPSWEKIAWAAEIRNANLPRELRESVLGLSFDAFEHLMRQVFLRTEWAKDISVTKVSHDDGIDFEGKFAEKSSGLLLPLVGQAKHWRSKVGSEEIRTFLGSIAIRQNHRSTVGVYVSTFGFTEDGLRMIRKSPYHIIWFDLERLADMMIAKGIGVSAISFKGLVLDTGFWNDLHA
jgi:restriction endonuclease